MSHSRLTLETLVSLDNRALVMLQSGSFYQRPASHLRDFEQIRILRTFIASPAFESLKDEADALATLSTLTLSELAEFLIF